MEETSFIEGEELFSLPCENPLENQWGAALVFGSQWNINGKQRTESTAVNRIEFIDEPNSLGKKPRYLTTMDQGTFNGYRTWAFLEASVWGGRPFPFLYFNLQYD